MSKNTGEHDTNEEASSSTETNNKNKDQLPEIVSNQ